MQKLEAAMTGQYCPHFDPLRLTSDHTTVLVWHASQSICACMAVTTIVAAISTDQVSQGAQSLQCRLSHPSIHEIDHVKVLFALAEGWLRC